MEPLLRTYGPPKTDMIPTSVDFVSTEPQQLLVAYTPAHASILDLETGRSVLSFDFGSGKINLFDNSNYMFDRRMWTNYTYTFASDNAGNGDSGRGSKNSLFRQ
jgi:hypothetical protein